MDELDASKLYVCSTVEYDQLKQGLANLVPVDLRHPIDPQLIFFAEALEGAQAIGTNEDIVAGVSDAVDDFIRRWQVTKATRTTSIEQWAVNALVNLESLQHRHRPLESAHKGRCVIVGNGPSLGEYTHHLTNDVITCWHAVPKLIRPPLVVCHMDAGVPAFGFKAPNLPESTLLVGLPTTSPQFYQTYPVNPLSVMCSDGNILEQTVASLMGLKLVPQSLGTVVYMQCLTAILMGYKELLLVGVDLKPTYFDIEEKAEADYTIFASVLGMLPKSYPDIQFKTVSNYRPIEGIEYVSNPFTGGTARQP